MGKLTKANHTQHFTSNHPSAASKKEVGHDAKEKRLQASLGPTESYFLGHESFYQININVRKFIDIINEALKPEHAKLRVPEIGEIIQTVYDQWFVESYLKPAPDNKSSTFAFKVHQKELGRPWIWAIPCEKSEADYVVVTNLKSRNTSQIFALDEIKSTHTSVPAEQVQHLRHENEVVLRKQRERMTEALKSEHTRPRVPDIGEYVTHASHPDLGERYVDGWYRTQEFGLDLPGFGNIGMMDSCLREEADAITVKGVTSCWASL
jgi:hypothetical protein